MESQFSLLIFLLLFFFSFLWASKRHHKQKPKSEMNLPPGPWKLPLLGNIHQLLLSSASSIPHHALRELSLKYGPLMQLQLGEMSVVVVSSPDITKEIMKTHDLVFAQRLESLSMSIMFYGSADIAFAPYGDYWRQMRKISMVKLLSVKRVKSFSYIREDEVAKLIDSVESSVGSEMDLSSKIYCLTSAIITRVAFGKSAKDHEELLALQKSAMALLTGFVLMTDLFPSMKCVHLISGLKAKLEKMHKRIDNYLEDILKKTQENVQMGDGGKGIFGEESFLETLLRIKECRSLEIPFTANNIKAIIWDIFVGGTDTSAIIIEWAMSELMRNPRVRKKAQAEIREAFKGNKAFNETDLEQLSYLKSVIKETLRLHPPLPLLVPRECRESLKINGYEILIKTQVIVNAWALGRDSNHWHEAERFLPERFYGSSVDFKGTNFEYIPFGAGRRICPGISFGIAGVELLLARLLYHFDWELPTGMKPEDLDMTEAFGPMVGRKNKLYLIPTPSIMKL